MVRNPLFVVFLHKRLKRFGTVRPLECAEIVPFLDEMTANKAEKFTQFIDNLEARSGDDGEARTVTPTEPWPYD